MHDCLVDGHRLLATAANIIVHAATHLARRRCPCHRSCSALLALQANTRVTRIVHCERTFHATTPTLTFNIPCSPAHLPNQPNLAHMCHPLRPPAHMSPHGCTGACSSMVTPWPSRYIRTCACCKCSAPNTQCCNSNNMSSGYHRAQKRSTFKHAAATQGSPCYMHMRSGLPTAWHSYKGHCIHTQGCS